MITKGTEDYKRAQQIANELQRLAECDRWYNNSYWQIAFNSFYGLIWKVKELPVFAAKIAETLDSKCNPMGKTVAYLSSKQAWILACACVENNIELN